MTRARWVVRILRSAALAVLATGCFAVVDVDRFKQRGQNSQFQDLHFRMEQATSHVSNYCEYRIVDPNGVIRSRAIIDPLSRPDVDLRAPLAVPIQGGQHRIDWYCDKIQLRAYNGLGKDNLSAHAWRVEPLVDYRAPGDPPSDPNDGVVDVHYIHDTNFTDIADRPTKDLGFAFKMKMTNMGPFIGKLVEVRVSDKGSGQTLGLYRFPNLAAAEVELTIPGIILDLVYVVDVYADANANGTYDDPAAGGDFGWRIEKDGAGGELRVDFDPNASPKNVSVGAP